MPRVTFVKKARKDNPAVKKGEPYYWWKFRFGGKQYSRTRPRPSQLTRSAYYGSIRSLVEQVEDSDPTDFDEFDSLREEVRGELENIMEECQSSLDNMPEQLQYAPTGELLQERIDACDAALSEIDSIDEFEFDEDEFDESDLDVEDDVEGCRAEHEANEEERRGTEFSEWLDNAKSELAEAVGCCEV